MLRQKVFKMLSFRTKWANEEGYDKFPVGSKYGNVKIPAQEPQALGDGENALRNIK
jgi:hypothetical protein